MLSNIYLNELDKFAAALAKEFYAPRSRVLTVEYNKITGLIGKTKKQLATATGQEKTNLLKLLKELRTQLPKVRASPKPIK